MTTVSREKILEALNTIRTVCQETKLLCAYCPLRDKNCECMLETQAPCDWKLVPKNKWRAFDD